MGLAALVLVPALLHSGASGAEQEPSGGAAGPNIVVIMTDDQTVESMRVMPDVDRLLARAGTTFANSFASFPLCCPSRATFLTGQYSHNHHVVGNNPTNGLRNLDQTNTLPVWLQGAGYATIFVGKYLNGYGQSRPKAIPPGWSEWYAGLRLAYFDHSMNRNGTLVRYRSQPGLYQTDVYRQTAVDAIRRHSGSGQPFFLWLSFFAPHAGGPAEPEDPPGLTTPVPAPRHRNLFATEPLPASPSFDEIDLSDKPSTIQRRPALAESDVVAIRESYQQRLESLLSVDEAVGAVVEELRRARVLDETVIVFTSDNGFFHGEHHVRSGKELLYEPAVRVPLIVRGPGVPRGARLSQPVVNADLAPTIAELAGAKPTLTFDGRSLVPLFADRGLEWGRDLLLERGPGQSGAGPRMATALRTPRYQYAEHVTGERELYDFGQDPSQLDSRHADPSYTQVDEELARRLASLRDCAGRECGRGPALRLALVRGSGCVSAVEVEGADERLVADVDFFADGRALARDAEAPFARALTGAGAGAGKTRVRALAVLSDGRRVTLDRTLDLCRG